MPLSYYIAKSPTGVIGCVDLTELPTPSRCPLGWKVKALSPISAGEMQLTIRSRNDTEYRFSRQIGNPQATPFGDVAMCQFLNIPELLEFWPKAQAEAEVWAAAEEQTILRTGESLAGEALDIAEKIGVKHPEKVRIARIATPATPPNGLLADLCHLLGFITVNTASQSFGYGINLLLNRPDEPALLAHELTHVRQHEALGGIPPFLDEYSRQMATHGFDQVPLEKEAIAAAAKFRK